MLLNSIYNNKSLVEFISAIIQEVNIKIKSRFLYIDIFYENDSEKEKILKFLPSTIATDDTLNSKLIIKKSDLICLKAKVHNPFRIVAGGDEYNIRLMMYLLFEATDLWKMHCFDTYNTIKGSYHHDMRVGEGLCQKSIINYIFKSERYSGRMKEDCISDLVPLCFPDPELLKSRLHIHCDGNYHIFLSKTRKYESSVLFKVVNKKLETLELQTSRFSEGTMLSKLSYQKECLKNFLNCMQLAGGGLLVLPFHLFHETLGILLSDKAIVKEVEGLLKERQQCDMVNGLVYKFFQDKDMNFVDSGITELGEARDMYQKLCIDGTSLCDSSAIEEVISSLQSIRLSITTNLDFFSKMNGDKGILYAQQYFRGLTSLIAAEISFLESFKYVLTTKDLQLFLDVTCKDTHSDINRLLTICDFFTQKKIIDRDAILKFTKSEISELTKYVNYRILLLNEIVRYMNNNVKVRDLDGNFIDHRVITAIISDHAILSAQFIKDKQLVSYIDMPALLKSIKCVNGKWVVNEKKKSEWLLYQLKLHPLMDYLEINLSNVPHGLLDKELNDNSFLDVLRSIIKSNNTNKKFVYDVKISHSLRVLQILYNISRFIPFSSLWLYYINPSRYRTVPGYVGNSIRQKMYTKNKKIPVTSFSSNIIKSLRLDISEERFVESYYEAKFLKGKIRKDNNIAGRLEKLKIALKSNKFIAYMLLSIAFILTLVCAIIGRIFVHLNIVPGIFINKLTDSVQGIFDSLFVIVGLDSVVDKLLMLVLDIAGIVVRILDFILLCGLLSEFVRFVVNLVYLVSEYIYDLCENTYKYLNLYGFKDSCIILFTRMCCTKEAKATSPELQKDEYVQKYDMNSGLIEALNDIYDGTKDKGAVLVRINSLTKKLSSEIDQILCCGKPRFEVLLRDFETSTARLTQDVVCNVNYIKLKYEFTYLLNNYIERFSYCSSNGKLTILNSSEKRTELYDKIAAVNLQTKYFPEGSRIEIRNPEDVKHIFDKVNSKRKVVTIKSLNRKIASLKWGVHALDVHDVYRIKDVSELVFLNTKIDHSITVMLYDCILRLESYRKRLQSGESISEDFINTDIESNFLPYIMDVYYVLQAIDSSLVLNGQTESIKTFFDAFLDSKLLLKKPSAQAKSLVGFIQVDKGTVSCFSRIKKSFCEFIEYFQDPKSIAVSFIVYYLIRLTNSVTLLSVVDYVTQVTDHALDMVMLEELYEYFTSTDFGKLLLIEFYQKGLLLKDITFMFSEFNLGFLCNCVEQSASALRCQDINYFIYSSSFHSGNIAQERLSLVINGFARIAYEGAFIGLVRQVINCLKRKMVYNAECFMLCENIVSGSVNAEDVSGSHDPANLPVLSLEEEISCAGSKGNELLLIDRMFEVSKSGSSVVKSIGH